MMLFSFHNDGFASGHAAKDSHKPPVYKEITRKSVPQNLHFFVVPVRLAAAGARMRCWNIRRRNIGLTAGSRKTRLCRQRIAVYSSPGDRRRLNTTLRPGQKRE
jgi:hypothetical protein